MKPNDLTPDTEPEVLLYCDGACSPNPGVGGWGVVLLAQRPGDLAPLRKELSGAEAESTNNRMELTAALNGLRALKRPTHVRIITDSQYVKNAFTQGWIESWQRNGWKTAGKSPVKNVDLWQGLIQAMKTHSIQWLWVRGHCSTEENNRCDEMAVQARLDLVQTLKEQPAAAK